MSDHGKSMHPNPDTPDQESSPIVPMVYEEQEYHFEYKYIRQNLDEEEALDENRLNELGKERWELISVFSKDSTAHYYFKRLVS